jgi:hypothetical protein
MKNRGMLLQLLLAMAIILSLIVPASVAGASATVPLADDGSIGHLAVDNSSADSVMALNTPEAKVIPMVAAGGWHTVGLKSDGTVVAVGRNMDGECGVGAWTDITQVAAGGMHTVGLRDDGTLVAAGDNGYGQCDIGSWTNITQVAAGYGHTMGLKNDGTVVAVGWNQYTQCDVGDWTGITQVVAGYDYTVGLKSDGTVVAVGWNQYTQCDIGDWTGITQVAAAGEYLIGAHTVGVKADGSVVAVGQNNIGQCGVDSWTDIIGVAAGSAHTVGLKSDGSVVAVGDNDGGQCNVGGWNLVLAVPPSECFLTISSLGGSVTTPGEETFTYGPGTVVDLVAEPDEGNRFVLWTVQWYGNVDSIADVSAASTTIIMDGDHAIRANFVPVEVTELNISVSPGGLSETEISVWVTNPQPILSTETVRVIFYFNDVVAYEHSYPSDSSRWGTTIQAPSMWPGEYTIKVLHEAFNITGTAILTWPPSPQPPDGGIMAGDWIKLEYKAGGSSADQPYPECLKLEFLSVGRTANVRATLYVSDGTEQSDTVFVDPSEGGGEALGLAGFVIPPNLTTGDSVYISGYGDVTIEGETTRTYAGARRRVVHASFSQSVPPQDEVQLTYYWDKLTGVMVEASTTAGDMTATGKATETNMWEATTGLPWWLWVVIAVAIAGVAFVVYRLRKRKTSTAPTPPPEGS